jgi:glutamine synthetase
LRNDLRTHFGFYFFCAFRESALDAAYRNCVGFNISGGPISKPFMCGASNRSAACRIPMYSADPKAKRVEFRCPDPACNPYLAFAAMLMAGIDGIQNRIDPGEAIDKNLYDLPPEALAKVPSAPGSLEEALDALEADHQFLLKGDVFTLDVVETHLSYKR